MAKKELLETLNEFPIEMLEPLDDETAQVLDSWIQKMRFAIEKLEAV